MSAGDALRAAIERAWWSPRPGPLSRALLPLSALYGAAVRARQLAFRRGWLRAQRAPVPVVVVGNLVVGGAGKTPTVIALVEQLRQLGWTPGIVSRGHGSARSDCRPVEPGSSPQAVGDEPLLMRRRTGAPVWVGRDRPAVARALCRACPEVDILVSDDGLQHLGLARDAQVVVFDARGFGNGRLLPAGPLREPPWRQLPPRSLVLYNGCAPSTPLPGPLARPVLAHLVPLERWWAGDTAAAIPADALRGQTLRPAAGIGNPERFFAMLERLGLRIERWPLPDHAVLDPRPWPDDGRQVVVTEKDAVKLPAQAADARLILVVTLDLVLPGAVVDNLRRWLPAPPGRRPPAA